MKTVLKISLVVGLLLQHLAHSEPSQRDISNRRISLYQADLVCPAAPQIGCGSAAKPILMGLESDQLVSEAWLSRAGTVVAVVWKQAGPAKEHARIIRSASANGLREITSAVNTSGAPSLMLPASRVERPKRILGNRLNICDTIWRRTLYTARRFCRTPTTRSAPP